MDSRLNGEGEWDYGWDAVWESGTARHSDGWSSEMASPMRCLRFPDSGKQEWAVNFQRVLSRTSENGWYNLPESDLKMGLSSCITADFTINPDFGQVEADEAEMNLGHFELFLSEKRPFFMERSELFSMPFNSFYSRRIGAVGWNGDTIPILGGAKITGSIEGGYSFGFLNGVTGRVREDDTTLVQTAANFGIFRGVKQFEGYNCLGISAVSKDSWEQEGFEQESNRALAVDASVSGTAHLIPRITTGKWMPLTNGTQSGNR